MSGVSGEVGVEGGEEEAFQDLGCWGEEGDGAVGSAFVNGFAGLGRGMTRASFQIAGRSALAIDWLKRVVR